MLERGRHKAVGLWCLRRLGDPCCVQPVRIRDLAWLGSFTSGTFFSRRFVLCSQVIMPLLYSEGSTSTLYPSFCCHISLMLYIFSQLPCVTRVMDFLAVVLGSMVHLCIPGLLRWLHSVSPWDYVLTPRDLLGPTVPRLLD